MTNEEKANSIINGYYYVTKGEKNAAYNAAIDMAAWKDEQINKILKIVKPMIFGGHKIKIDEILDRDINWKEL